LFKLFSAVNKTWFSAPHKFFICCSSNLFILIRLAPVPSLRNTGPAVAGSTIAHEATTTDRRGRDLVSSCDQWSRRPALSPPHDHTQQPFTEDRGRGSRAPQPTSVVCGRRCDSMVVYVQNHHRELWAASTLHNIDATCKTQPINTIAEHEKA